MSDIKLFNIANNKAYELEGTSITIEKSLQSLIESNLETFFGIKFLETEYSTGVKHGGRIDTLGIDENNCPVIIEYKRTTNENVINQGLFYLDWLLDHKAEFQLIVQKKLGQKISDSIEWNNSRLICIAGDFTKYDSHAIQQINRNIELIRYKKFKDLILFDLINAKSEQKVKDKSEVTQSNKSRTGVSRPTVSDRLLQCSKELQERYENLKTFIMNIDDDIQLKILERYFAFKKIKTFASLKFQPAPDRILLWVNADISKIKLEEGFTKDVTNIGHHGIGNLEIRISNDEDLEKAKPYILKSYEMS